MGPEWRTKYIVAATVEFPAKHPPVSTVAVPRSCPESLTKPKANEAAWRKKWHFLFSTYCLLFIVRHGEAVPSTAAATSTPSSCGRGSLLFGSFAAQCLCGSEPGPKALEGSATAHSAHSSSRIRRDRSGCEQRDFTAAGSTQSCKSWHGPAEAHFRR